jgi:ribosomal protein S18 acetylase RimI-like enzyme
MTPADPPVFRQVIKSGLGPHVVGQRIVVRRVVRGETGPTGGPAMTDVLGICESWDDEKAMVRREDGSMVEIRIADIVSGKPVPPRPSVRQRVTAREAESHAGPHWPGILREPLGEWEFRFEPEKVDRLRKRANSCLAFGDPGIALADAAAAVQRHYRERGRPPLVQVEVGSEVDDWFDAAGWTVVEGGDALFMLGSLSRARRLIGTVAADPAPDLRIDGARADAVIPDQAFAKASIDDDWIGVHNLYVEPELRRRGLARAVVDSLLEWGAEQGATTLWLHVETTNDPAIALYGSMGLDVHHGCRYLTPPS